MNLALLDFEFDNGIIWFVDVLAGCLWKKNIESGALELIAELPRTNNKEQYRALKLCNGKLFIAPLFAKDLIIYDIDQHSMKTINLEEIIINDKPNYVEMISYGKYIFCIPMSSIKILRINTVDDIVDFYEYDGIFSKKDEGRPYFRKAGVNNNFIFMGLCDESKLIRFDMENLTFDMVDLNFLSCDGFSSCNCTKNEIILMAFDNSKAFVINQSYKLLKEYSLNNSIVFANYLTVENEFFCVDCNGNGEGLLIDVEKKNIRSIFFEIEEKRKIESCFSSNGFSLAGKVINGEVWIFITNEGTLNKFTKSGQLIEKIRFDIRRDDEKIVNRIIGESLKNESVSNEIIKEDNYITVEAFINSIL